MKAAYSHIVIPLTLMTTACQGGAPAPPKQVATHTVVDHALGPIDAKIEAALHSTGTPGAALVVVRDGRIVHARGMGSRTSTHAALQVRLLCGQLLPSPKC